MALKKTPPLESTESTTYWWGDDAVDHEASAGQLAHWCETGEPDGLVMRAGAKPAAIVLRPLGVREVGALPERAEVLACAYQACRYGLVSIDGVRLRRMRSKDGLVGIIDVDLDALTLHQASIPGWLAMYAWLRASGFDIPAEQQADAGELLRMDLAQWIGAQVLARTFRLGLGG